MAPQVTLIFDLRLGLYHPSALYTGLDALDRGGAITLKISHPRGELKRKLVESSSAIHLKVKFSNIESEQLIAIDLADRSDHFQMAALEACDVYLKRSFYRPDLVTLCAGLREKMLPFGLNYACTTGRSTLRLFRAAGLRLATQGFNRTQELMYRHVMLPTARDFEQLPMAEVAPSVVFQTRVWPAEETAPGEDQEINEGRVRLIRALKEAFGDRFIGGLVSTPLALARYPNEVSTHSSRRKLYTAMSKSNLIGIYSRGLHGSTAFKLAEYLAASQCIVAEPPRNELPVPLEPGRHFLPFQSIDECVANCQRLLADQKLAGEMRRQNHEYYVAEVEPAAHMIRVLERCAARLSPNQ